MTCSVRSISKAIALVSLLAICFSVYSNIADDPDFWWHLKTGQYIFENKSIPKQDSFSFTSVTPEDIKYLGRTEVSPDRLPSNHDEWFTNLAHSWLGQVIFYAFYLLGGLTAVTLMKSAVLTLALLLLYYTMRSNGGGFASSYIVIAMAGWILRDFCYSRPQVFSFLFFVWLIYILCDYRKGGRLFYIIPPIMMLWSNIHAGFVVGITAMLVYVTGETIEHAYRRLFRKAEDHRGRQRLKLILLTFLLAFLAGLANPNGYKIFLMALHTKMSLFGATIQEYAKPNLFLSWHAYAYMLFLCAVFMVLSWKELALAETFLVLFFATGSLNAIRLIPFFALGSGTFLARSMSCVSTRLARKAPFVTFKEKTPFARVASLGISEMSCACLAVIFLVNVWSSGRVFRRELMQSYPTEAITFIQRNHLPPNLFNEFEWGGFLIWSLPQYPVFIDGRCLNETTLFHYNLIRSVADGTGTKGALWKRLLEAYKIQIILTTALERNNGKIRPLVHHLYFDPSWDLAYQDGTSLIFLKGSQENRARFKELLLPKEEGIFNEIFLEGEKTMGKFGYYATLGNFFMDLNNFEEARKMYINSLAFNPNDRTIRQSLLTVEQKITQGR